MDELTEPNYSTELLDRIPVREILRGFVVKKGLRNDCLDKYEVIKCVFFVQEESGCIGSSNCNLEFFNDCRFVLQCDRRGSSDLITSVYITDLCSEEFLEQTNYKKFGYKETDGMLTDVYTLKTDGLNVSCLNISCGYYNPHSEEEYTVFSDLVNCLNFVQNIIENCTDVYTHICQEVKSYSNYSGLKWGGYGSNYHSKYWSDYYEDYEPQTEQLTDDEWEIYNEEYNQLEDIISSSYTYCLNTKSDEEIANDILDCYAFQYITKEDVLDVLELYR